MKLRPLLALGCTASSPHGADELARLVEQARRRGLSVVGVDTAAALAGPGVPDGLSGTLALEWPDQEALATFGVLHTGEFSAVLTHRERCVVPTAQLAQLLGVRGNSIEAARLIQAKDQCREALRQAGLPQPRVVSFDGSPEAALCELPSQLGPVPWVVKPRTGMGSEGVFVVHALQELPAAISSAREHGPILVEQFVHGQEYSAEGVMINGRPCVLALTQKRVDRRFVETGHRIPADLPESQAEEAVAAVSRALVAAKITAGIFHVEFWVGDGVVLGELHARPGGDFIHRLVELTRPGLELFGLLIDDLVEGRSIGDLPPRTRAAGAEYLTFEPGRLVAVHGWPTATATLQASALIAEPGTVLNIPRSSEGRHAVLVANGANRKEVEAILTRASDGLSIEVEAT